MLTVLSDALFPPAFIRFAQPAEAATVNHTTYFSTRLPRVERPDLVELCFGRFRSTVRDLDDAVGKVSGALLLRWRCERNGGPPQHGPLDDPRQPSPTDPRLLLSPWRSERVASPRRHDWHPSFAPVPARPVTRSPPSHSESHAGPTSTLRHTHR